MPIISVTTKVATQVWASPDGQRKIYELQLDYAGQPVKAKTYSDAIATVGWSGTVETYEKAGRNGVETFVKQPPKEGGSFGGASTGSGTSSSSGRGYSGGGKAQTDPFTMYLSYAKDLMVARIAANPDGGTWEFTDILDTVVAGAYQLYQARPDGANSAGTPAPQPDTVHEPVDLSLVDKVFNPDQEQEPELPWPTTT